MHRACAIAALKDVCDYFTRELGQVVVRETLNNQYVFDTNVGERSVNSESDIN